MSHSQQMTVCSLKVGEPLETDLTDSNGVLMLRAGVVITDGFIETLLRRGIDTVATRETPEAQAAREEAEAEQAQAEAQAKQTKTKTAAGNKKNAHRGAAVYSSDNCEAVSPDGDLIYKPGSLSHCRLSLSELNAMSAQAERAFDSALDRFLGFGSGVASGQTIDVGLAADLVSGFQRYMEADPALVLMLLRVKGDAGQSLYRHGIKTSMLSMTLAGQMGFRESQVTDAGVAALVHDLGMLRVPENIRAAQRRLTPAEWLLVREHPTHTLNILDRVIGISESVKTAAYQVHERCDASGYPKKRHKQFIHPLAKVIAVADTYAALTDDRPHREALTGHEAMKPILREVQAGKHDRGVARALLDTMSMYPVGSVVGLSDGRSARVLRGVPGQSITPVVVVIKNGEPVDWELDLGQVDDLSIVRVLSEQSALAA